MHKRTGLSAQVANSAAGAIDAALQKSENWPVGGVTEPSETSSLKPAAKRQVRLPRNTWIVKPGENSNRGAGIEVCKSL